MKKNYREYIIYATLLIIAIAILIVGGLAIKPKVYPLGCKEGDKFSSSTGAICDPNAIKSASDKGCDNNAAFNIVTGEKCPVASSSPDILFPFSNPARS